MREFPIAILCSDLHLSHKAPIARSEEDWYEVMKRQLEQLDACIWTIGKLPIICAGDIFDRWNPPAELINFALEYLPSGIYAIPGQHDLPYHSYEDIKKSGYWTLVASGKIKNLPPKELVEVQGLSPLVLHGFPFGVDIERSHKPNDLLLNMAVVHKYVWHKSAGYTGAPEEGRIGNLEKDLKGYDVAVFGDNHSPFHCKVGKCQVWNCGGFFRRKSDEKDYEPAVGLLYKDGRIERKPLDISKDKFSDVPDQFKGNQINLESFLDELQTLSDTTISFEEALNFYMDKEKTPKSVRDIILKSVQKD